MRAHCPIWSSVHWPAIALSAALVTTGTVMPLGAPKAHSESFNTLDVLSATVKQFWTCSEWSPVGACFWLKCSFLSCQINVSPKYRNHAPEAVVQTYHKAGTEPWVETRVINDVTMGSNSNLVVRMLLNSMGSWLSSLEGGAPSESRTTNHRNLTFKNVDIYTHPLVMDIGAIENYMEPSQWPTGIPDPGDINISGWSSVNGDRFDADDFSHQNPPWSAVDQWDVLTELSAQDVMDMYGLSIEYVLPDGCDAEGVPTPIPNPNYGDAESVCSGVFGINYSCTNITDEFLTPNISCALKEIVPDLPSFSQIMRDFTPDQVLNAAGIRDASQYIDVPDVLDNDEFNELRSEFGNFIDLQSMTDWVFCSPRQLLPLQPMFQSHKDLIGWRFNMPEMFYPQSLNPFGENLSKGINDYGPIFPRHGYSIQHDPLKESALTAFRSAHFTTRKNEPHVYQTLATKKKEGYWPPGPLEKDYGKWSMISPVEEQSCHFFPYTSDKGSSYRDDDEAAAWMLWREYSCCADLGQFLFDITLL